MRAHRRPAFFTQDALPMDACPPRPVAGALQVLAMRREEIADLIQLWSKFGVGVDERSSC